MAVRFGCLCLASAFGLLLGACSSDDGDAVTAARPLSGGDRVPFSVEVGGWEGLAIADAGAGEVVIVDSSVTDLAETLVYRRSPDGVWTDEVIDGVVLLDPEAWVFEGQTYVAASPCDEPNWDQIRGEELGPGSCGSDAPMTVGTIDVGGQWEPIVEVPGASIGTASVSPGTDGRAVIMVLTEPYDGSTQAHLFDARTRELQDMGARPPGPSGSEEPCVGDEVVVTANGDGVTTPAIVSLTVFRDGKFVPVGPPADLPDRQPTSVLCDGGAIVANQPHTGDGTRMFVLRIEGTESRWEEVPVDDVQGARFNGLSGQRSVAFRAEDQGATGRVEVLAKSRQWEVVEVIPAEGGIHEAATLPHGALLLVSNAGSLHVSEYSW